MTIRTKFDPPPMPDRRFDWSAMHEPDNSEGRHVGWGATEAEAIEDLKRLDEERAEYLEWKWNKDGADA